MPSSEPRFANPDALRVDMIDELAEAWLIAAEVQQLSERTVGTRKDALAKLVWWCRHTNRTSIDTADIRAFLRYVQTGHTDTQGRWGNPNCTAPVSARTVRDYHNILRTFFHWLVAEGELPDNPMQRIPSPVSRPDQIQPFTREESLAIIGAARLDKHPKRALAIVLTLLDTGLRASELVALQLQDLNLTLRRARVTGKGDKRRTVVFSERCARALLGYLRTEQTNDDCVFAGTRGPLTRSGLLQITTAIGDAAGVPHAHPHRFRHTFAVEFLRAGGDVFTLQALLGHTHLQMTQRYVQFAQTDIEHAGRRFSPVEAMLGGRRSGRRSNSDS